MSKEIEELNSAENVIKPSSLKENDKITTTLTMDKETLQYFFSFFLNPFQYYFGLSS